MTAINIQTEADIYQVLQDYLDKPNYLHNTEIHFDFKEKLQF